MTNIHLKNLGISILDMTPTDLEMEGLTPQQLEDVVRKVTRHARISGYRQGSHKDNRRTEKQRLKIDRDRRAPREKTQKVRRDWRWRYLRSHQESHS